MQVRYPGIAGAMPGLSLLSRTVTTSGLDGSWVVKEAKAVTSPKGPSPRLPLLAVAALAVLVGTLARVGEPATAAQCHNPPCHSPKPSPSPSPTGPPAAWVTDENDLPGTTAWQIPGSTPRGIAGFADHVSAQVGDNITLYVSTKDTTFHVEAYRLGYYQGLGGRLIWTSSEVTGIKQPGATITSDTNTVRTSWSPSLTIAISSDWVQGNYLLKLVGSEGAQSYVPLVIRDDSSTAAIELIQGVNTWEAYNMWGGADLYKGVDGTYAARSRIVTFDRPYGGRGASGMLTALPFISLVEQQGMDITYTTDVDLQEQPSLLLNHQAVVSLDHDEYWSAGMRDAMETARSGGVNLAFLGANAVYRQIRYQDTAMGPDRDVICYKVASEDPLYGVDNAEVTVNWRQAPVLDPESALLGAMYQCDHFSADMVVSDGSSWVFAGTGLSTGDAIPGALSMEYDAVFPDAPTPGSIEILAHSPLICARQTQYADMTYYTASSGAGVIDIGSQGWVKVLQCGAPVDSTTCDPRAVQITENILNAFAQGPAGIAHPSQPNLSSFGITLTEPTSP
jgi:hypothetical protein